MALSEAELRDLIDGIKSADGSKDGALGARIISGFGLRLGVGCAPLLHLCDAVALAEAAFPGEYWELRNHDSHPHYVDSKYNASLGGKTCEAVRAGADLPERALTLAVLELKFQLLPK